ncbi:MAG: DUF4224 domain-containing protein [Pseudomonadota bacterium]
MTDGILQFERLAEIVGRKSPARVVEYLRSERIPYRLNADGKPYTSVQALGLDRAPDTSKAQPDSQPNFSALGE